MLGLEMGGKDTGGLPIKGGSGMNRSDIGPNEDTGETYPAIGK